MKKSVSITPLAIRLLLELGCSIRLARLRRKLSLRAVAQRAGISVNTVTAIENGESGVSVGAIVNVLHCLNLANDLSLVARDDELGRKLQDLEIDQRKRAPKKPVLKKLSKDKS